MLRSKLRKPRPRISQDADTFIASVIAGLLILGVVFAVGYYFPAAAVMQ